jgi:hypothetical protein
MGPTIILDKSSLQALSKKELILLNKLYYVNIPSVLIMEILADLKKANKDEALNEEKVIEIANKLIQKDNAHNVHYSSLIVSSLMGVDYLDSRRPLVGGGKKVKDKSGKIGVIMSELPEQEAVRNWQKGNFSEAEKKLAAEWRAYTKEIDLESAKKQFAKVKESVKECKDIPTLIAISENYINNPISQQQILAGVIEAFGIDQTLATQIFYRWECSPSKLIKDFAPYFYYTLKIDTVFRLGIVYNLITTRSTNRIDSEYLYYLPFCNIFSSRDKFHKDLAPFLLTDDQTFIDGDDLKADLNFIIGLLEKEDEELKLEWTTNFSLEPPNDEKCLAYRMWKKYLPSWNPGWFYRKTEMPQKDEKRVSEIKDRISSVEEMKTDPGEVFRDEDIDFISYEYQITLEDQCPCGSGKKFGECCYRSGIEESK